MLLMLLMLGAASARAQDEAVQSMFLVASEDLLDPNFRHTVVLVARHGKAAGVVGVVLNRPTEVPLSRTFPQNARLESTREVLSVGGPVMLQTLTFLFRSAQPPENALEVLPGIYLSFDGDTLVRLLERDNPTDGLRVFAGHSGWAPGQLEKEVAHGGWHLLRADPQTVFRNDGEAMWEEMLRRAALREVRHSAD
jgi:putative transcriptional regulator